MSLTISSKNFSDPLLKPLLEKLMDFFNSISTKFFVIGATARDIILDAHGEKKGRATRDLDIAIAITDWSKYEEIEKGLVKIEGFSKDSKQKQRFIYNGIYELDIVPFGDIMSLDDKIFWPPDEQTAMSVLGLSEVDKATHSVVVDEKLTLDVAPLAGIFLLKIVAWQDRNISSNKDAEDLGFILSNYLSIKEDSLDEEDFDIYEDEDFDIITAGGSLIGKDIKRILKDSPLSKQKIAAFIKAELDKKEESKLINQIIETNKSLKYEQLLKSLENIIAELSK
ncbi:MAG: nucleotidyl transferase AbiEii/AbiGii toxin family protein [Breznakibacter sp.]